MGHKIKKGARTGQRAQIPAQNASHVGDAHTNCSCHKPYGPIDPVSAHLALAGHFGLKGPASDRLAEVLLAVGRGELWGFLLKHFTIERAGTPGLVIVRAGLHIPADARLIVRGPIE